MSKPAEVILEAYETDFLKQKLFDYPREIFNKKKDVRKLRDALAMVDQERAVLEADMIQSISDEKDPNTGKPKFSNEATRAGELTRRKAENAEYCAVMQEVKRDRYTLSEAEDELEMLQDAFKAARYVVRLVSEEIALMGSEDTEVEEPLGLRKVVGGEPF